MYSEIQDALKVAGQDDRVVVAVLTGAGDYYCSGNDLSNFTQIPPEGPQKLAAEAKGILRWVSRTRWHRRMMLHYVLVCTCTCIAHRE